MAALEELRELCKERDLITSEIYPQNEWYGRAALLKRYAGYSDDYQIKAIIENFLDFGMTITEEDIASELPSILIFSKEKISRVSKLCDKSAVAIGPLIRYAKPILTEENLEEEKKRLGKNLLYIASFNKELSRQQIDLHSLCTAVEDKGRDFSSIRVCLHWKDIHSNLAERIEGYGFELVSPGHVYDPLFLPRLKSIIEASTVVAASSICMPVGYAVLLGVPMFLMTIEQHHSELVSSTSLNESIQCWSLFNELSRGLSGEQKNLINKLWGTNSYRTPEELNAILQEAEDIYQEKIGSFSGSSEKSDDVRNGLEEDSPDVDGKTEPLRFDLSEDAGDDGRSIDQLMAEIDKRKMAEADPLAQNEEIAQKRAEAEEHKEEKKEALSRLREETKSEDNANESEPVKGAEEPSADQGEESNVDRKKLLDQEQEGASMIVQMNALVDRAIEKLHDDDIKAALGFINKAEDSDRPVKDLFFVKALCYVRQANFTRAKVSLIKELELFPANSSAKKLLQELNEYK